MRNIISVDTEVSTENNRILDIGAVDINKNKYHGISADELKAIVRQAGFVCGHNIIDFDMKYLRERIGGDFDKVFCAGENVIDTLYLSALLFPMKPYHHLIKDDKLDTEDVNNPQNDAENALKVFCDEIEQFNKLDETLKKIYYTLLKGTREFGAFFKYISYENESVWIENDIKTYFRNRICENTPMSYIIREHGIEMAYALSLVNAGDKDSITPPWIVKKYPMVQTIIHMLCGIPCEKGCEYCNSQLDAKSGLKKFFGYDDFRKFDGVNLQEKAVNAAIRNKSLLAVFPTGGGKSITFQLPALMAGQNEKGLTVVISPLQSLMIDQVYNLERIGITDAVTINGNLEPLERAESIRRVKEGDAKLLYIAPEMLRSRTIEKILTDRNIVRFVIDEAHCFSAWGQDFRVDYLYIAEFIRNLCKKKNLKGMIPVSCFTATAKQNVINDICYYFKSELNLELEVYRARASRDNLSYTVIRKTKKEKYNELRKLLDNKKCPTIIYVSRTKNAQELSDRLNQDGYFSKYYHGKMDRTEKNASQNDFIEGKVDIMVATSAFGMGVDKKDVGMVIHYDISDSLENYIQEAGRAGRDAQIHADCYILFDEEDLNKHFTLLNQTRISMQEIQQIWRAIKELTKTRQRMSASALEIARKAGWDESINEIETRVKTAINALEDAGYIKRGQNMPHIYADSILAKNVTQARAKIESSNLFSLQDKEQAVRIITKMIAGRSRKATDSETPETRIDYIADDLGMEKQYVLYLIQKLRDAQVLSDALDLTANMPQGSTRGEIMELNLMNKLENFLILKIQESETIGLKELNEAAIESGIKKSSVDRIKTIINFWTIKKWIARENSGRGGEYVKITYITEKDIIDKYIQKRYNVSSMIIKYLGTMCDAQTGNVEFSVKELVDMCNLELEDGMKTVSDEMQDALLYLSKTAIIKIEGGFLVSYNAMNIVRLEKDNKIKYKAADYKKLKTFYEQKVQMVHIVGEYARKMTEDYNAALVFVDDYFQLEYAEFIKKYFKESRREEINKTITAEKFEKLFGSLSPAQLNIINDKTSSCIVVAAGPGSGKTRILVHKLASLLMLEDVKHEQLLMLTFSRAAATEFSKRLYELIGDSAGYVEIKTFHSYCFDLLGRVGNIDRADNVVAEAVRYIKSGEVQKAKITKAVIVVDEAQDMDVNEYNLLCALCDANDDIRIIAVGDDDQNIYKFRGSDAKYMRQLLEMENSKFYELVDNYRSMSNIIAYTNLFALNIADRMKKTKIEAVKKDYGKINIIEYTSSNLVTPLVEKAIADGIYKDTCILTVRNEEAMQVAALLKKNNIPAQLIQENDGFRINKLQELYYFNSVLQEKSNGGIIPNNVWDEAKEELGIKYGRSSNYNLSQRVIQAFENENKNAKYYSDWELFLWESNLSDFYDNDNEKVIVSTMHKSKGHEYEHVILLVDGFEMNTEENKRLLYVAMTRAKTTLTIHYNRHYLIDRDRHILSYVKYMTYENDDARYYPADEIELQTGLSDVNLSYFANNQEIIQNIEAGDIVYSDTQGCYSYTQNERSTLLLYSRKYKEVLKKYTDRGYKIKSTVINYMVYWKSEDMDKYVLVALPRIHMSK